MTQTTIAPTLLRLDSMSKSFGGVHALANVSFELARGEVHALVGENGAGKTTLIKIITGAHVPDAGTLEIDGQVIDRNDPTHAKQLGIAAIYQQPALFAELTVAENIALRIERGGAWRTIRWRKRLARATELLNRVGTGVSPLARVSDLSMPQQQLVEIAAAIGAGARILVLDEPTASLSGREVEHLFAIIGELRQSGVGMIYISHRLDELPRIADRVTVLRDGHYVGTYPMAAVQRDELIRLMVGRPLDAVFPKSTTTIGEVVLEARDLNCRQLRIRDASLTVRAGEILGLAGLVGAGRTELARLLFGLHAADSGEILWRGRPVSIANPAAAVELGIAYIPEDRRRHGVIPEMPVAANTTLATLRQMQHSGLIDFAQECRVAGAIVERLAIKTPSIDTPVANLSGGNQQKVAIARWLVAKPQFLILDEPTQGVDVGAKAEIHRLISELAGRGMAILMISSELPEILGMSDRVAVMHAGTIVGVLERSEATQEKVLALALGVGRGAEAAA